MRSHKPTNRLRMTEPFRCYGKPGEVNAIEVDYDPRRPKGCRIVLTVFGEGIELSRGSALELSAALDVAAGCYTPEVSP